MSTSSPIFDTGKLPAVTPDDPPPLPPPVRIPKNSSGNSLTYTRKAAINSSTNDLSDTVEEILRPAPDIPRPVRKPVPVPRTKKHLAQPTVLAEHADHEEIRSHSSSSVMVTDLDQPPEERNGYLASHHVAADLSSLHDSDTEHLPLREVTGRYPAQKKVSDAGSDLIKWESVDLEYLRSTMESLKFMQSEEDPDVWSIDDQLALPPSYSPPPPPPPPTTVPEEALFDIPPPPLPPRPLRKDAVVERPLLPSSTGNRVSTYLENEVRNGVTTLRSGMLSFRQSRCWCVLKDGKFSVFNDRKTVSAKLVISCNEMFEISAERKNPLSFGFEICSLKERSKPVTFVAESNEERTHWLQTLAKCICDAQAMQNAIPKAGCREFDVAGKMNVRHGASGQWIKSWIELAGRTLHILSEDETDECDLRKVISFSVVNVAFYESKSAAVCPDAVESSNPYIVTLPGRVLYFQADFEKATTHWMKLMQQKARECGTAIEDQPMTSDDVPVIVQKCIEFVSAHGLKSEGIYRHSGVSSRIAAVLESFAKDGHGSYLSKENFSEHDVAGALKRFFRNLPEPVITLELYQPLLHCGEIEDVRQKLLKYQSLLEQLPPRPNYVTLKKLLGHLRLVSEFATDNKMSIPNIASSFGSTLMSGSMDSTTVDSLAGSNFDGSTKEITVLVDFLTFYEVLFKVKAEELQKERNIVNALESINKQMLSPPRAGDFLMGVYWIDRKGEAVNMRIKSKLTAGQLCRSLMEREKMEPDSSYALHEVIFDDKLYRPVLNDEEVIPIIMRWTQWNETNICPYSANYLCVRRNDMHDKIAAMTRPPLSLVQQLRFAKEKSFKKIALDFSKMNLTCFKNLVGDKTLGVWRIEDIIWFRGCSPQRSPPSKWNFTFIEKDDIMDRLKENRTAFGYTVCCDEEADLIKWISAIVQAQQSLIKYSGAEIMGADSLSSEA